MSLVVITGGIGAGKSTILKRFAQMGAVTIDADEAVHRLYTPGSPVVAAIAGHFGTDVLAANGELDRKALAAKVFGQPLELAWLNGLIHPRVRKLLVATSEAIAPRPLFAAVPLWYECGWQNEQPAKVIAVWCDSETQLQRLRQRGWSDGEIQARLKTQLSMDEKLRRADYGIMTNCSWDELDEQCRRVFDKINSDN